MCAGLAGDSSSDSSDEDNDDDDDNDEEDSEAGEETCPPGCDPALYDKVMQYGIPDLHILRCVSYSARLDCVFDFNSQP